MRERPKWFPVKPRNKRLPRELYEQPNIVWFFTIRAYLFQSPFVRDDLNRMVIDTLRETRETYRCNVFVYCLMPDHLHLLTSPREAGASVLIFTERFKGKTTNLSWKLGWKGALWQPGSYDHGLRKEDDFREIAEYTLENPVRKVVSNHQAIAITKAAHKGQRLPTKSPNVRSLAPLWGVFASIIPFCLSFPARCRLQYCVNQQAPR